MYSEYIGIKAWLNAPSAKNFLKTFGIFNTTTKISWKILAPRRLVVNISLIKPATLEINVQPPTLIVEKRFN
jgi:hypothetical protein